MLLAESLLGSSSAETNYIEDVFSTYLYTGNGTSQTITNGVDLSGKGGLVWVKRRQDNDNHRLVDTVRGVNWALQSNTTSAENNSFESVTAFNSNGFTVGNGSAVNFSGSAIVSWTFRKQAKFFDVVTYTGDGTSSRNVAHSLGSAPGAIFIKATSTTGAWKAYCRSSDPSGTNRTFQSLVLNTTAAAGSAVSVTLSSIEANINIGTNVFNMNALNVTYVAYLFAHDAGGFGLTGTDNVISCGAFTMDSSGSPYTVTLGYEPQLVIVKRVDSEINGNWYLDDSLRGMSVAGQGKRMILNETSAENNANSAYPTATGFSWNLGFADSTWVYIAIRRGPMKTPTTGTSVFSPIASTAATGTKLTTNFPIDLQINARRAVTTEKNYAYDRLREFSSTDTEGGRLLTTQSTGAESTYAATRFWDNTGFQMPSINNTTSSIYWNFRRAPGFFDIVCYKGTGANGTVTHNLGVTPELMIVKGRSGATAWQVYSSALANTEYLVLNTTAAKATGTTRWNSTTPTSSVFSLGTATEVNTSAATYVAYLFATVAGVSKVFSYTGNGTSQTINCGFTGGSRFVLIKRTDSTGNWTVFDSARGIVAGNDPYLLLNSNAAEVTTLDVVDTNSSGFIVNQEVNTNLNVNSATYIGLAIA